MLFNSPEFIFGFVPLVLLAFFLIASRSHAAAIGWLTIASLFFYGWWNPVWVPLLLGSIAFNLVAGRELWRLDQPGSSAFRGWVSRKGLLWIAIGANLTLLFYFKYVDFVLGSAASLLGIDYTPAGHELPLGISFFTFTQIAFLVDVYQRKAADFDPVRYGLFVTYYPHLIAGPVLHHREMMPQFARPDVFRFDAERLAQGTTIFILGLFKKVVLADQFAQYASPAFAAAATRDLTFFEAWSAALSYTLQLYFDFSGYSDMAIGLALMIGVRLPLNFHSPYKALNIADFWRRWHMTLSRFLRDYLYIPLGGNRRGPWRQQVNLLVTMLLGGIWHGAGWTYVVWGALHGLCLVAHRGWRWLVERHLPPSLRALPGMRPLAWSLTFLCVVVGWVFFRAADLSTAFGILAGMAGQHGSQLPEQLVAAMPPLGWIAEPVGKVSHLGDGTVMGAVEVAVMLGLGMAVVLGAPAMHELSPRARLLLVVPCAALALQRVLYGTASEFLYFQF